jgi:hypothetical protein
MQGRGNRYSHTLKVRITGKKVEGFLDDKLLFEYELPEDVSSRSGCGRTLIAWFTWTTTSSLRSSYSLAALPPGRTGVRSEESSYASKPLARTVSTASYRSPAFTCRRMRCM